MRQVAGGENVRQRAAGQPVDAAAFGQVRLDEGPVGAGKFTEWMQRLDHAGALGPAAAGTGSQGDHGKFSTGQSRQAGGAQFWCRRPASVQNIGWLDVLDLGAGRETVLGEADAAVFQILAHLLVLPAVETVLLQQLRQALLPSVAGF
jgi:hypothetical protein